MRRCLLWCVFLSLPTLVACGNDDPAAQAPDGAVADAGPVQPTGLLVAALDPDGEVRLFAYAADRPPGSFRLTDAKPGPVVRAVEASRLRPLSRLDVQGEGFADRPAAAVAVLFTAPGALPTAVPAVEVSPTHLVAATPALVTADGQPYVGPVEVRVVQVVGPERTASAPLTGVELLDLPTFSFGVPPGEATAAYLSAGIQQLDAITQMERLPADFVDRAAVLRDALVALANAVDSARSAGSALAPWQGGNPGLFDAEVLALTDRLAFALLQGGWPGGSADTLKAATDCVAYEGSPEQQMKSLLCQRTTYGEQFTARGGAAIAWGAQVEMAVFTGFYGSAGGAVLGATTSPRAALAFETIWAGLSGHIAAFATAVRPPTVAATLRDAGAQLVDTLTRAGGALATLTSMLSFAGEYDRLIRQAAQPPPHDAGPTDAGPADAGPTDAGVGPYPPVLEGIFEATQDWPDECATHLALVVVLTVENLAGSGTPDDPFTGHPTAVGSLTGGSTVPGGECEGPSTRPITALQGHLGGTAGRVVIEGDLLIDGVTMDLEFLEGRLTGDTLRGPITVRMPNPQLAPFTGEIVLTAP